MNGPTFVRPTVGRVVHYFSPPETASGVRLGPFAATITYVHERDHDRETGEEIGTWVVSLAVYPPAASPTVGAAAAVRGHSHVPLEGFYDEEDVEKHPEWVGGWNWPPRVV